MSDPLSLVRNATVAGVVIAHEDGHYVFGTQRLADTTKTCFKRTLGGTSDVYYYTLRDVLLFLQNYSLTMPEYRKKAAEAKAVGVVEKDRPNLYGYLTGAIDDCPQLDHAAAQAFTQEELQKAKSKSKAEEKARQQQHKAEASTRTEETGAEKSGEKHQKREHKRTIDQISNDFSSVDRAMIEADRAILAKLRADEYCFYNRNTILNCEDSTGFPAVLKIFNDAVLMPADVKVEKAKTVVPESASSSAKAAPVFQRPIIVVPNAVTSEINLNNIAAFLKEGVYVHPKDAAKDGPREKVKAVDVNNFKIIDDPSVLRREDWDRVVAVFVTGQTWQFKKWKYETPVELFQNVLGIHLVADDRAVDPIINTWNCKILKVNRFKQHLNASTSRDFWRMVNEFIRYRKPHLDITKAAT